MSKKDFRFWDNSAGRSHSHVYAHNWIDALSTHQATRKHEAMKCAALTDCELSAFGRIETQMDHPQYASFNIMDMMLKTMSAEMVHHRIYPFVAPAGAGADARWKAYEFNRFIAGLFDKYKIFQLFEQLTADAVRWGLGSLKITNSDSDIFVERVFAHDLIVHPGEAQTGSWNTVRTLGHRYLVDKDVLNYQLKQMGVSARDRDAAMKEGVSGSDKAIFGMAIDADNLTPVSELWHKPSGKDADDGKWFYGCRSATFALEKWDRDGFPFTHLYLTRPATSVFERSIISKNYPVQKLYDELTYANVENIKAFGTPAMILRGDTVQPHNVAGGIYRIPEDAQAPVMWNPVPINSSVENFRNNLPQQVLQFAGIPEQWATGKVPAWLQNSASGKAQEVAVDEGSKRFAPTGFCIDDFFVEVGKLMLDACRDVSEANGGFVVDVVDGETLRKVDFKEVDPGAENYITYVKPINYLSRSPSARFRQLQEMADKGLISPKAFMQALGDADVEALLDEELIQMKAIDKTIENILRTGELVSAFSTDDFDLIIDKCTKAINRARSEGEDDEKIQAVIQYQMSAIELKNRMMTPPEPPPMAPPVSPEQLGAMPNDPTIQPGLPPIDPGLPPIGGDLPPIA